MRALDRTLGRHVLMELSGCSRKVLNDRDAIEQHLLGAAEMAGATVIAHSFRKFEPQGVSGFVMIAESHLSIHTWPEYRYAAVDIFTCGNIDSEPAVKYLVKVLKAKEAYVVTVPRGAIGTDEEGKEGEEGKSLGLPEESAKFQVLL